MKIRYSAALWLLFLFSPMEARPMNAPVAAEFQVVRVSPEDRAAVIKSSDNELSLIREGSRVQGVGTVTEISENRLVTETSGDRGGGILIIRMEGGRQWIERIRKAGHRRSLLYAPESSGIP